ncbi:MAG: lysine--tRNA ligase [Patescibacteria group bacterium]|nr:lysine--tRNA ligase [Patescibacteria group bacterium]
MERVSATIEPMAERELREERLQKLAELRKAGIDPYPSKVPRTETVASFIQSFDTLEKKASVVSLAGRVMSYREHGGIAFADLFDGSGRVQIVLRKEELGDSFTEFLRFVDQGDFISVSGVPFTTKRGERSLKASSWQIATKAIVPPPSEWYGVQDEELRLRERYLEILLDPEVRAMFERRAHFWQTIRSFLVGRGFMEVETPTLELDPGGADARPFMTHHHALDTDVYLRISAGELWQKRLLVAGFEKIFEIGRIFRNEGMSSEHLQDYTQLEFYSAFEDYRDGMKLVQELYRTIAREVYGKSTFTIREHTVDLDKEWEIIDYSALLKKKFNINVLTCSPEEAIAAAEKLSGNTPHEAMNKERAVDLLWKQVRRSISGPAFLAGVPVYMEPLAKRSPQKPTIVERFQVILAGSEIGKGYSELNDPIDQHERFKEQESLREKGDQEAQRLDQAFVEALEYGMPPALGFGVSERLFSFLENKSVRETQFFPLMRRKGS